MQLVENNEKRRKSVLLMTIFTSFFTSFMGSALNLSIPGISSEFSVSAADVGWAITIYTLVVASSCVPMGRIADSFSRRKVIIIGLAIFCSTSLVCAFATSMTMLIILRGIQGVGAAMIFATNNAILLSVYPKNESGKALGMSVASTYTGLSAGPVVGGIVNHSLGWRAIFIVGMIATMPALYQAVRHAPEDGRKQDASVDVGGIAVFSVMIALFLYGVSLIGDGTAGYVLLAGTAALMALFIFVEKRASQPIIILDLFSRDKVFSCSCLATLMNYGATFAISYLVSIYLQMCLGYSSSHAGLVLVTMPVIQAALSPGMGRLSDRVSPYKMASLGMLCCSICLAVFAATIQIKSIVPVILALACGGLGFSLFSSPNNNALMSRVPRNNHGMGTAIISTMRTVGQSLSMCIVTVIVNLKLGSSTLQSVDEVTLISTMKLIFVFFAVMCIIGVGVSSVGGFEGKEMSR